jgi:integrase/recombinase XerD
MEPRHVRMLRDEKLGPEAANGILEALRALFSWAVTAEITSSNPAKSVPKIRYKTAGFHTWTLDEVRQYEAKHPPESKPRLALYLLLYTGARRGDVIYLGRQMIARMAHIYRHQDSTLVSIPIVPELQFDHTRKDYQEAKKYPAVCLRP